MEKIIAYCGIVCSDCEAYKATQANDQAALAAVAAKWQKEFGVEGLTADSIMCDGCLSINGRGGCHSAVCEIRACALDKKVVNCAHCADYGCDTISAFLTQVPTAKATLDGIRQSL